MDLPYLLKDTDYPVGGANVATLALMKGLIHNGCRVGIITWKGAKNFIGNNRGIDIIEAFGKDSGIKKIRWIYYRYPLLVKAIKNYSPDYLLQTTASMETGIIANIAKKLNIPMIYRVASDMDVDKRIDRRLSFYQRKLYKYGLKHSKYIVTQNEFQYNKLRKRYPHNKVFMLVNAFYPSQKSIGSQKRRYIAWVGLFRYEKNLPALLNIAHMLPDITFKIAGKEQQSGIDRDIANTIASLRLCKNVQFVGYLKRNELNDFLANAYALLNTSYYEGFPNTFLEAFALGTPIISLYADPNGILKKYKLGFVVDPQEVAQVVRHLINNYDYGAVRIRMKKYLDSSHNYKVISKKLIEILEAY